MKTLLDINPGQSCQVKKVHLNGNRSIFRRLLEMGFIDGTVLKLMRFAPLGDPVEIELHGYFLTLRKAEAAMVEIYDSK